MELYMDSQGLFRLSAIEFENDEVSVPFGGPMPYIMHRNELHSGNVFVGDAVSRSHERQSPRNLWLVGKMILHTVRGPQLVYLHFLSSKNVGAFWSEERKRYMSY